MLKTEEPCGAIMLLEVFWNLVESLGFEADYKTARVDRGNTLFMQLVVDGLKMQPCRPSFLDARDAILQADHVLTGGRYACLIWKGFAKRGLGIDVKVVKAKVPWQEDHRTDGFTVPSDC